VRFADTAAELRRDVQDSHSAATAANRRLVPVRTSLTRQ
jgi:hypothetical protein